MKFNKTVAVLGTATLLQFIVGTASFSAPTANQPEQATEQALADAVKRLTTAPAVKEPTVVQLPPVINTPSASAVSPQDIPPTAQAVSPKPAAQPGAVPAAPAPQKTQPAAAQKENDPVITLDLTGKNKKTDPAQSAQSAQIQYQVTKKAAAKKTAPKPIPEPGFISQKKSHDDQIRDAIDRRKSMMARTALGFRGTPYVWGGSSPRAFDCSGFTQYLYKTQYGISLPHNAKMQYKKGKAVSFGEMLVGDLVFFNTRGPLSHVGMYLGNGKFVHAANPRRGVRVDSVESGYYRSVFAGARRYH